MKWVFLFFLLFFSHSVLADSTSSFSTVAIDPGIVIVANEFDGETTRFIFINDTNLESVEGMVIEDKNNGQIEYIQKIDLASFAVDQYVNLNANINISHNKIIVNSSNITSLNAMALLKLNNLTWSSPQILKDGNTCTSCAVLAYENGTLEFFVAGFSTYTTRETPAPYTPPSGGGSGGGSSGGGSSGGSGGGGASFIPKKTQQFVIDNKYVNISSNTPQVIRVTNVGTQSLNLSINTDIPILTLTPTSLPIKPKETALFKIQASNYGNYFGRIYLEDSEAAQTIDVSIQIEKPNPNPKHFAITSILLNDTYFTGRLIETNISVFTNTKGDFVLMYALKDFTDNTITFFEETTYVYKELAIIRTIPIPKYLSPGKYLVQVQGKFGNLTSLSNNVVQIFRPEEITGLTTYDIQDNNYNDKIAIILLICLFIVILIYKRHKRGNNKIQQIKKKSLYLLRRIRR